MTTKPRPCQAENPGLCPHHGAPAQITAAETLLAEAAATGDYNLFTEARDAVAAGKKRLQEAYALQDALGGERIKQEREDPPAVDLPGHREWHDSQRRIHRDGDKPAVLSYGQREYYKHGLLHREGDKPAVESKDGARSWHVEGKLHRVDAPAVMRPDGSEAWFLDGKRHRDGDLPAVTDAEGTTEYYKDGLLHREDDKPARVIPGRLFVWLQKDKHFREGGKPQVLRRGRNGNLLAAWYDKDGREEKVEGVTEEQFKAWGGVL